MIIERVGRKVIEFIAVSKSLLNALDHAADHGRGDLGCA